MPVTIRNWQAVRAEVLRRIQTRTWKPGDLIPNEADLAAEFGCARATVNRALRAVADAGLLDRRRKAGTRVAMHPVRKATLDIPVIRLEIEGRNRSYGYSLISRDRARPPPGIRAQMHLRSNARPLHIVSLHSADAKPYVFEDRWINAAALPAIRHVDFDTTSANEWLVMNAPFTRGDIAFAATGAGKQEAEILGTTETEALFVIERITWDGDTAITSVRLTFAPGYRMHTRI